MSGVDLARPGWYPDVPTQSPGDIGFAAFAALAIVLGCPPDDVDLLYHRMRFKSLPKSALDAVEEFRLQIAAMTEGSPGDQVPL